jgi:serine/threonine protein kinase
MIGKTVSHFRIQGNLGEGGMGKVYLGTDVELQRKVALKFLLPQYTEDEDVKSRFKVEARTMASLNHPNITTIYEVGEYENSSFIAMEYVEGESLQMLLHNKEITVKQAIDIMIQVCEGLGEAHKQGIVHRDIKPGNLLLEKHGRIKILDFGLAKLKEASKASSKSSTVGTLYYLSPEQIQNISIDHRADLFACGVVLYEMITGQVPFKGDYEAAVMYSILNEQPELIAQYKSGISESLQKIVDKTLSKDPDLRYQRADDLLSDLKQELHKGKSSKADIHPDSPARLTRKLAAIMFIDIVGYSRMMGKDEEATIKLLEEYESLVSPLISRHKGIILKKIGDGLFCEFSSAIDAVDCSLEIQKTIHGYNQKSAQRNNIYLRIGIHVGDVIKKNNDLFGDGVNVAARIEPLAPPGGIYISDSVHSAISSHPRFKIRDIGLSALKNIEKQHNLYQVLSGHESSYEEIRQLYPDKTNDTINQPLWFQRLRNLVEKRPIIVTSIVVIIAAIMIFQNDLYNLYDSMVSDQKDINITRSIESDSKDNQQINSKTPEILRSGQSIKFVSAILRLKNIEQILDYLQTNQDQGKLKFGRQDQFSNPEGSFIIISDENQAYNVLYFHNAEYFDTVDNQIYKNLSDKFRKKRTIWIKLFNF